MNHRLKKTMLALCCSGALFLTACNDNDKDDAQTAGMNRYVKETPYVKDKLSNAAAIKVMTYTMKNVQGQKAEATALVFYPKTEKPKDGWRVVVWEHGTVGVGDDCAPSNTLIGENFGELAQDLLAAGYIIVAPDYEGLGTRGIHPYLNLQSEAESAVAAMAAFKMQYGKVLNGAWMSAGQSQGGQASLGTAEYANTDPTYKGAVAGAPASSLGEIILEVAPGKLRQLEAFEIKKPLDQRNSITSYATLLSYAALTGIGIKAYEPRFEYRELFQPRAKDLAALGEGSTGENGMCLNNADPSRSLIQQFKADIIDFMTQNPGKSVMDYPGLDEARFKNDASVKKFLVDSQPGTKRIDKPVFIIQGAADTNVPMEVTEKMVANLVDTLGSPNIKVDYVAGASHTAAIKIRRPEVVAFIQQHMPAK